MWKQYLKNLSLQKGLNKPGTAQVGAISKAQISKKAL